VLTVTVRHVTFVQHFFKYADHRNTKYAAEICANPISYIFYGVSLASVSCRLHWPAPTTLALTLFGK